MDIGLACARLWNEISYEKRQVFFGGELTIIMFIRVFCGAPQCRWRPKRGSHAIYKPRCGVPHSDESEISMRVELWVWGHPEQIKPNNMDSDEKGF